MRVAGKHRHSRTWARALAATLRAAVAVALAVALLLPCTARAQTAGPPPAPDPPAAAPDVASKPDAPDAALEEAKTLFRQGNELRKAGDWQGALARYQRSRARVPSLPNTMNAAICLDFLGRFDEALELYEHALTDFPGEVTEAVRQHLTSAMSALRPKLGSIDVSANVNGAVVVDGRTRGTLPLLAPVRVLPGTRRMQVLADGYTTWEDTISVAAGQSIALTARLSPLRSSGRGRVDSPGADSRDVSDPRERAAQSGRFFVEALGGVALGASLGSGAEQACDQAGCTDDGLALGMLAAARGGYELANRLSFGLALGYLRVRTDVSRARSTSYGADSPETPEIERQAVTYAFEDALLLSGPFVLGGVGFRVPVGARLEIALRLEAGAILASASDVIDASVSDAVGNTRQVDVTVTEADGNFSSSVGALLVPQVGVQLHTGRLHVGAGLALVANLVDGPALRTGQTQVRRTSPCSAEQPQNLSCAPRESFVAGEQAFGRFVLWTPTVSARFDL